MNPGGACAVPTGHSRPGPSWASAEHLNGYSSLPLLGNHEDGGRLLYLLEWPMAVLASSNPAGQSGRVVSAEWHRLPLADHSFDLVVIDLDAVPERTSFRHEVPIEMHRLLRPGGQCIAVVTHRRRARDPRDLRRYRLIPPLTRWTGPLANAGLTRAALAHLRYDGTRIAEVQLTLRGAQKGPPATRANAVALVLQAGGRSEDSLVQGIAGQVRGRVGGTRTIDRVHVRKIGKAAAFLPSGEGQVVVRMPCSPVAVSRARTNHLALEAVHTGLAAWFGVGLLPKPLYQGIFKGRPFFVETCVPGSPRVIPVRRPCWEWQAVEFVTELHRVTAQWESFSSQTFEQLVEPPVRTLEEFCGTPEALGAITWLRTSLRECLLGRHVPLVRCHGDFTDGNCLYDDRGRLSGVVDWELSSARGLPLLDLVQALALPFEYGAQGRWHRAEVIFDAVEGRNSLASAPEVTDYLRALRIPTGLLNALFVFYWVDHVGARIPARHRDRQWVQRRVMGPLRRLERLVQEAPAVLLPGTR